MSYPNSAPQPQFWQAVMPSVVNMIMIIVLASWALSQVKKALRGEEVRLTP